MTQRPSRLASRFDLGSIVSTPAALRFCGLHHIDVYTLMLRHARGDWGDVCAEDAAANEAALDNGARLFSVYKHEAGDVWIITDAVGDDGARLSTCMLLPSEY